MSDEMRELAKKLNESEGLEPGDGIGSVLYPQESPTTPQDKQTELWPAELRRIADKLCETHPPTYPGDASQVNLLREIATWLEVDPDQNVIVEELLRRLCRVTALADETFGSWHRIEFGSQAKVNPDIKQAYLEGFKAAESAIAKQDAQR